MARWVNMTGGPLLSMCARRRPSGCQLDQASMWAPRSMALLPWEKGGTMLARHETFEEFQQLSLTEVWTRAQEVEE